VLIGVGAVWLLRSIPVFGGAAWWSFYAQREQGFTEGEVGLYLLTAYALGCTGYLACARLMVWIGYRVTAIGFMVAAAVATVALFQTGDRVVSFVALAGAVGFGLGMTPVLAAFASEPFPTELRGQTGAWARSFFELPGFVLGPALVGVLGDPRTGLIGSIGQTVTWLVLLIVPACYVVWRYLPETAGRELDDLAG
jgi:MFS family permease